MKYKVFELLKYGKSQLLSCGLPEIEARYLLEFVLNKSFTELTMSYHDEVSESKAENYKKCILKRLKRMPLQHITQQQLFFDNIFYVDENVLIPRPETELLVEDGISYIKKQFESGKKNIKVLDMCTGSGCIAISIGNFFAIHKDEYRDLQLEIIGVDISIKALHVAKINSEEIEHNGSVSFVESDLFEKLEWNDIDLIISNPPYIPPVEIELLMPEVKEYEPRLALDGGDDGLDFYRSITTIGYKKLRNEGMLLFEIGHGQMEDIKKILVRENYKGVNGKMDLQGLERIVYGIKLNKPD